MYWNSQSTMASLDRYPKKKKPKRLPPRHKEGLHALIFFKKLQRCSLMVHFSLKPSLHADISVADNAKKIVS